MKLTHLQSATSLLALAAVLLTGGCKSNPQPPAQQSQQPDQQTPVAPVQPAQQQATNSAPAPAPQGTRERERERDRYKQGYADAQRQQQQAAQNAQQPPRGPAPNQTYAPSRAAVIPAGTHIVVSLGETISSKTARPGDSFSATVAEPVVIGGATLIKAGSSATGTVVDAKALGRFKGGAELSIRLDSVHAEGRTYQVASSTVDRVEQGKGKRTAVITGGGGGLGALIGGLAGGGKGALIGGLAGAGAGGAGSALTGNKELVIPAETALTFRLERNVSLN